MLHFFPYLTNSEEKLVQFVGQKEQLITASSNFPSGLSQTDFIWDYLGTLYNMEFAAGFFGFKQDPITFGLRPEISWAVLHKEDEL